jgi:hypothetical protein
MNVLTRFSSQLRQSIEAPELNSPATLEARLAGRRANPEPLK